MQPPTAVEQQLCTELQVGLNAYLERVRGFVTGPPQRTPAQALQLIQVMHEAEGFIERFAHPAEALRRDGFPVLSERVLAASQDVGRAKAQYFQMYTSAMQTIGVMERVRAQAEQYAIQQVLAATYHQQAVFDKSMRGVRGAETRSCSACGLFFGDAFPYFNFCPHCGASM
jgi:hypothetical protein